MNIFSVAGKFLDQPLLVAKFEKKVPLILGAGSALYGTHVVKKTEEDNKKSTAIRVSTTLAFTAGSALLAPKITNKLFKQTTKNIKEIKNNNKQLIDEFVKNTPLNTDTTKILEKAKDKVLNFKDVKKLHQNIEKTDNGKKFLNKLIPEPENITSKEIFSEIGRLSILGLIPVLGGITGGIIGDKLVDSDWKSKIPNKIKEGTYQYLANIFLCNVGAGMALGIMEKANVKSKSARALGMISGIAAMGIVGGSAIANAISNKVVNPLFGEKDKKDLYAERKPEAIDIGLHTDDIATIAVMSGLKWIEPALPIMYAISGYRAGIGYRNVKNCNENNKS